MSGSSGALDRTEVVLVAAPIHPVAQKHLECGHLPGQDIAWPVFIDDDAVAERFVSGEHSPVGEAQKGLPCLGHRARRDFSMGTSPLS